MTLIRMMMVVLLPSLMMVAGCATDTQTARAVADANARAALVPTVRIRCEQGCEAEYHDPAARATTRMPTSGWDAMIAVGGQVTGLVAGAVPYAAVGAVAVQAVRHAGHNTQTTTTTTNTASGAGASTGGTGTYSQIGPDSNNTTTADSHNTATDSHAVDDHSATDSHNATATPTVVLQMAPVIVDPVVVQVPAPAVP